MQRMGMLIGLKADKVDDYKKLHADVWPGVLAKISEANIRNYSIFLKEPENQLFGYWEYHGTDFEADMALIAADPETQRWWDVCNPCQVPPEHRKQGEWWGMMNQVFHLD